MRYKCQLLHRNTDIKIWTRHFNRSVYAFANLRDTWHYRVNSHRLVMHRVVWTHIAILKEGYEITASAIVIYKQKLNLQLSQVLQGELELGMHHCYFWSKMKKWRHLHFDPIFTQNLSLFNNKKLDAKCCISDNHDIDSSHVNIITSMKVKGFGKHGVLDHYAKTLIVLWHYR
jgi:hypothetical protein